MRERTGAFAVLIATTLVLATCSGVDSMPVISDARVGAPTGPNAAFYFTATGYGSDDKLVGATTGVAESVVLHESVVDDDGIMSMHHVPDLSLPGEGSLVLEPGSYHLMFVDVDPIEVGDSIEVTLVWDDAGEQVVEATVVDPADTMGDTG